MKKVRTIYDSDHYKMQLLTQSEIFIHKISKLKNSFKKVHCPIPKKGFSTYKDYLNWKDEYLLKINEIENSKELKEKINKITKNNEKIGPDEYYQIESLKEKTLPPIIEKYIGDILEANGILRKDKNYEKCQLFLMMHIFLGQENFSNPVLVFKQMRNRGTDQMELFVQILPNTRKEDVINAWPLIRRNQKMMPGHKDKIKEYKKFKRDLDIYNIYKKFQRESKAKPEKKSMAHDNRIDNKTYKQIKDKYGEMSWESIRKVVSNMEKFTKKVKVKEIV